MTRRPSGPGGPGARPARRGPLRWIEPWFSAYALAGLLVNGMVPIMIPVTTASHGTGAVATVVSAFFVGQLTAPFIGQIADRTGTQRVVFLGSYPVMAAAAVGFGLSDGVLGWAITAAVAGAAAGAAQTLGMCSSSRAIRGRSGTNGSARSV